jgi:hypothetical protein
VDNISEKSCISGFQAGWLAINVSMFSPPTAEIVLVNSFLKQFMIWKGSLYIRSLLRKIFDTYAPGLRLCWQRSNISIMCAALNRCSCSCLVLASIILKFPPENKEPVWELIGRRDKKYIDVYSFLG